MTVDFPWSVSRVRSKKEYKIFFYSSNRLINSWSRGLKLASSTLLTFCAQHVSFRFMWYWSYCMRSFSGRKRLGYYVTAFWKESASTWELDDVKFYFPIPAIEGGGEMPPFLLCNSVHSGINMISLSASLVAEVNWNDDVIGERSQT